MLLEYQDLIKKKDCSKNSFMSISAEYINLFSEKKTIFLQMIKYYLWLSQTHVDRSVKDIFLFYKKEKSVF